MESSASASTPASALTPTALEHLDREQASDWGTATWKQGSWGPREPGCGARGLETQSGPESACAPRSPKEVPENAPRRVRFPRACGPFASC